MRATHSLICLFHVSSECCSLNHVENLSSLLQVFKDSRWSHTHASTNPCAVAHKRHTSKLILTSVAVCLFHIATLQDGRWTALDFNMLETLVLFSVKTHKSHFQLPAPWSSMLCYCYAAKPHCSELRWLMQVQVWCGSFWYNESVHHEHQHLFGTVCDVRCSNVSPVLPLPACFCCLTLWIVPTGHQQWFVKSTMNSTRFDRFD